MTAVPGNAEPMSARVLDYHDILLREQDLVSLKGHHWLNDQVISFYFEYLAREQYIGQGIGFVGGSVAFFLANADVEDCLTVLKVLKLAGCELVMLAVNDNPDSTYANGGNHWSLLVYSRAEQSFRHFDSAGSTNAEVATALAEKMSSLFGLKSFNCQRANCPTQENGYDCGVHVLAAAESICRNRLLRRSWEDVSNKLHAELTPQAISGFRQQVLQLIQNKASC